MLLASQRVALMGSLWSCQYGASSLCPRWSTYYTLESLSVVAEADKDGGMAPAIAGELKEAAIVRAGRPALLNLSGTPAFIALRSLRC